jgi:hypothetical protein
MTRRVFVVGRRVRRSSMLVMLRVRFAQVRGPWTTQAVVLGRRCARG